jgi:hypothetical protein
MVKIGFRVPSLRKRVSARTSLKRYVRNNPGLRAPRGWGWLTNPRKAAYNRVYSRTTRGCLVLVLAACSALSLPLIGAATYGCSRPGQTCVDPQAHDRWLALNEKTRTLYQQGNYTEAVNLAKQSLSFAEVSFGPQHPDTIVSLNNLGGLYHALKDWANAEPTLLKALAANEKTARRGPS